MNEGKIRQMQREQGEIQRKMLKFTPIEGSYPKFIQIVVAGAAFMALDADGGIWGRQQMTDGTLDQFGNKKVVWIRIDDERSKVEASSLINPSSVS